MEKGEETTQVTVENLDAPSTPSAAESSGTKQLPSPSSSMVEHLLQSDVEEQLTSLSALLVSAALKSAESQEENSPVSGFASERDTDNVVEVSKEGDPVPVDLLDQLKKFQITPSQLDAVDKYCEAKGIGTFAPRDPKNLHCAPFPVSKSDLQGTLKR